MEHNEHFTQQYGVQCIEAIYIGYEDGQYIFVAANGNFCKFSSARMVVHEQYNLKDNSEFNQIFSIQFQSFIELNEQLREVEHLCIINLKKLLPTAN